MSAVPFCHCGDCARDRQADRLQTINTRIREDREQVLLIDEDISEGYLDWAHIVTVLADSKSLIDALCNLPAVAELPQVRAMPALATLVASMADEREKRLEQKVEAEFELSERDNRDGEDMADAA